MDGDENCVTALSLSLSLTSEATSALPPPFRLEKVLGLTGFVIIHVFIMSFSPAQGERNQILNAKLTRPVNAMPMSNSEAGKPGGSI